MSALTFGTLSRPIPITLLVTYCTFYLTTLLLNNIYVTERFYIAILSALLSRWCQRWAMCLFVHSLGVPLVFPWWPEMPEMCLSPKAFNTL